jgi:hypothetical protein
MFNTHIFLKATTYFTNRKYKVSKKVWILAEINNFMKKFTIVPGLPYYT